MKKKVLLILLICGVVTNLMAQNDSILLVFFSRAGENWNMKNGNEVGPIERGNTAVFADVIVDETGARVYEILPAVDYPYDYYQTVTQANQERDADARPVIKYPLPYDLTHYKYIFIGSPVWCGQCPMIMRTFYETYGSQLAGKTIIPFGTHEGSGVSTLVTNIRNYLPSNITLLKELGITGHNVRSSEAQIRSWVQSLNLPKQTAALTEIAVGKMDGQTYNLYGQLVPSDWQGIVIRDGKKWLQ